MRGRIFGAIGVLWGGVLTFRGLFVAPPPDLGSAYGAGQVAGMVFGALLLIVGAYYLLRPRPEE